MLQTWYNQAEAPPWAAGARELALDLETSGLDPWNDRIAVVTLADQRRNIAVVRCHGGVVPGWLQEKLTEPGLTIVGHNLVGFDALFLDRAGVDLTNATLFDTMPGELVTLTSGRRNVSVSLKATVKRRVGKQLNKEIDHGGWEAETLSGEQLEYVRGDVDQLFALKAEQEEKVAGTPREQAMRFEQELVPVTIGMTLKGMPLDVDEHSRLLGQAWGKIYELTPAIEARLGQINMRSHVQVKNALHAVGIMVPNTRKETMQIVAEDADDGVIKGFAKDFIVLRQNLHRSTVWDEDWVNLWLKADGCIHGKYWQLGTDTIRYSGSDPNMQQIPREWRRMFGGVPGHKVVSIDYSQLEVRVAAAIFNDHALAEVAMSEDIHSAVFARSMGMRVEDVTKEQRRLGKAINFLCIFGGGPKGYYEYCHMYGSPMTYEDCKQIVYGFWDQFKGVSRARERAIAMANSGRSITLTLPMGHQRALFGEKLGPTTILNTSVQGTAATGIKAAMLELRRRGLTVTLRMQVHDELVFLVEDNRAAAVAEEGQAVMQQEMARILPPGVPIATEAKIGTHWS